MHPSFGNEGEWENKIGVWGVSYRGVGFISFVIRNSQFVIRNHSPFSINPKKHQNIVRQLF